MAATRDEAIAALTALPKGALATHRGKPLPRTATGKVLKRELRDELTEGWSRA